MFSFLGTLTDMRNRIKNLREYAMMNVVKAREFIYQSGNTVDGSKVERTLGDGSWVPTIVSANSLSPFIIRSDLLLAESVC